MAKKIFRQEALDRLSSPEQLDSLMPVTSTRSWIVLAGVGMLLAVGLFWGIVGRVASTVEGDGLLVRPGGLEWIQSTQAGFVQSLLVSEGDDIKVGDPIVEIAFQTEEGATEVHEVISQQKGRILDIAVFEGAPILAGADLVFVENPDKPLKAIVYVPASDGYKVEKHSKVRLLPATEDEYSSNRPSGTVATAGKFPASRNGMLRTLQNERWVDSLLDRGPSLEIEIAVDDKKPNDLKRIFSGTPCRATITTNEHSPISFLFQF